MIDARGRFCESGVCWIATNATGAYLTEGGFYGYYLENLYEGIDGLCQLKIVAGRRKVDIIHAVRKFNRCIRRDNPNVRIRNQLLVHPKKVYMLIEEVVP